MSTLDDDKIKECKIVFDMLDKDKDTKITTKELGNALRISGAAPSQQELEMIIQGLEESGNNLITFEKFLALFEKLINNQDSEEDIINEFKKMDKIGNGTISEKDLRDLMSNYGNALTQDEIEDVIQ